MKKAKHIAEYVLILFISFFLRLLPLKLNLLLAKGIGLLLFRLNRRHRNRALENLRLSFPGKSPEELFSVCRKVYINLAKVFMEFLFLPRLGKKYFHEKIRIVGRENLDKALARKKGVIGVTAHLDNWELLGAIMVQYGYGLDAVYHPMKNPMTDAFFNNIRRKTGMTLIPVKESLRPCLLALKKNHILGLIADQDASSDAVFVDFFGRPAATFKGPALFAVKTGSPVIFFALVREKDDSHTLYIGKPLEVKITGELSRDLHYNTRLWSGELERWIRKYPEQWYWVHRRWHSRPRAEKAKSDGGPL